MLPYFIISIMLHNNRMLVRINVKLINQYNYTLIGVRCWYDWYLNIKYFVQSIRYVDLLCVLKWLLKLDLFPVVNIYTKQNNIKFSGWQGKLTFIFFNIQFFKNWILKLSTQIASIYLRKVCCLYLHT